MVRRMLTWTAVVAATAAWSAAALAAPNDEIIKSVKDSPNNVPAFMIAFLGAVLLGLVMVRRVRN